MRHLLCALTMLAMITMAVSASGGDVGLAHQGFSPPATLTVTIVPPASLLPSDRDASANWRTAGLLSLGGIPNRTTQCGKTLSPIGGGADDTIAIQTAINNCTAGQVVQLGTGTFTVAEGSYILLNKGITLRGAGPGLTMLTRATGPGGWNGGTQSGCSSSGAWGATLGCSNPGNNPTPMILVEPLGRFVANPLTNCALTSDAAQGALSVSVSTSCINNFSPGQFVLLDELSGASFQTDIENAGAQIWRSSDFRVVYKIHNPANAGGSIDDCNSQPTPASNCSVMTQYTYDVDRPTNEIKHVTAVNTSTNTVTFDSPVTISYRVSHTAWLSSWATPFLQQAGVENLTMNNADDDEIDVNQCAYCWLYKVEVTNWLGRGIDLLGAFRTQLDTLYVHEGAWCVPGGAGYNIGIDYASSEVYVVNSISNRCNKVMVDRAAGAGSVVAYNFMDDGYIAGTPGWIEIGANASHLVGAHHVLFEGNKAFNWDSDSTHGSAIYMTSFRNQYSGIRESFTSNIDGITRTDSCHGATTAPMRAIGAHIYTWWSSWLYNDLGTPGCTLPTNSWTLNGTQTSGHPVMYLLGADDEESNYAGDPNIQTIYPAVGPNCNASAPNCSSIISGNWLLGWTNTIAGTAWNTGNVSSGITLSTTNTTNDTATMTLSSGPQLAYSNDIVTGLSNRVYFELKCIETSTTDVKVGVTTTALSGGNYLGSNTSSLAFESGGTPVAGQMIWGGNGQGAFPPCTGGDTLGVALNLTSGQAFAHDYHAGAWSTNWNATAESQPTTGGYAFPSGLTGGVSMMISVDTTTVGNGGVLCTNASCGVNGGSGLPSGYSWWDSVANVGGGFSQSTPPLGPNSLFLSAKPSWWPSDFVWPPFTPDNGTTPLQPGPAGCGGTCPGLPAAARWDNGTPFVNP